MVLISERFLALSLSRRVFDLIAERTINFRFRPSLGAGVVHHLREIGELYIRWQGELGIIRPTRSAFVINLFVQFR